MHVYVTANVGQFDQLRQGVLLGGFNLTLILAELWSYVVELQRGIDFFLGRAGHVSAVCNAGERIFTQRVTHFQRSLPNGDIVSLRSGEVLQRGAVGLRLQRANVHLHSAAQPEADFVTAARKHFADAGES